MFVGVDLPRGQAHMWPGHRRMELEGISGMDQGEILHTSIFTHTMAMNYS